VSAPPPDADRSGRGRRSRLLLAGAAAALAFVLCELVARSVLADPIDANLEGMRDRAEQLSFKPSGTWTTKEGVTIYTNELGFRSRTLGERIGPKTPGALRVAVLGDSETFGRALSFGNTYGAQLERALQGELAPRGCEVFAFGIPGTNTEQHLQMLQRSVLPIGPDLVILLYCLNDIEFTGSSTIDLGHWYDRSLLVRYLRYHAFLRRAEELRARSALHYQEWEKGGRDDLVWAPYYASMYDSVLWDATVLTLRQIQADVRAAGAEFVLTTSTEITAVTSFDLAEYPHRAALEILRSIRDHGILFVDPFPAFARAGKPGRHYYVEEKNAHKNAEGNGLLVEGLLADDAFRAVLARLASGSPR
jgi:hypothetical protein